MTEHNLPDKDDAPWLDCMDGFGKVSNYTKPELSPTSLEVWSQYCSIVEEYGPPRLALAAALRETINQCQNGQGVIYSYDIFAIAAELEAQ